MTIHVRSFVITLAIKKKNLPSPAFFCCFLFPETKTNLCRLNFSNAFDWRETHLNESRDFFIGGNVTNYNVNIYLHSGRLSLILWHDQKILEKTQFDSFYFFLCLIWLTFCYWFYDKIQKFWKNNFDLFWLLLNHFDSFISKILIFWKT